MSEWGRDLLSSGVWGWAILVAATVFRVAALRQPQWGDEDNTIRFVTEPAGYLDLVLDVSHHQPHFPLYYLLVRVWTDLTGLSPLSARWLSVVAGVLVVWLTLQLVSEWWGRQTGLIAAVLVAFSPFLVIQSGWLRMYAIFTLATVAFLGIHVRLIRRESRRRWVTWVAVAAVVISLHPYGLLVWATALGSLLVRGRWRWTAAGVTAAVAAPYAALLALKVAGTAGAVDPTTTAGTASLHHLSAPAALEVVTLPVALIVGRIYFHTQGTGIVIVPYLLAKTLSGKGAAVRCWVWVLGPAAGAIAISYALEPIFQAKYLAFTAPAVAALCALGLRRMDARYRWPAVATLVSIQVSTLAFWAFRSQWIALRALP